MYITDDFYDEMEIDIAEKGLNIELDRLEYIIQMSLIKLRRFLTSGGKKEHERVLVLETLRQAAYQKTQFMLDNPVLRNDASMIEFEMHSTISSGLKDLGLAHQLHVEVMPSPEPERTMVPLVLVSASKKRNRSHNNVRCIQSHSGSIIRQPAIAPSYSSILEEYFMH